MEVDKDDSSAPQPEDQMDLDDQDESSTQPEVSISLRNVKSLKLKFSQKNEKIFGSAWKECRGKVSTELKKNFDLDLFQNSRAMTN